MNKSLVTLCFSLSLLQSCFAMESESAFLVELRQRFRRPQDVNSIDGYRQGQPFVHAAAARDDIGALDFLLDQHHAHIDIANAAGSRPIHIAVINGSQQILARLLAHHADVNVQDRDGRGPLHLAVLDRLESMVEPLLDHSASVDMQDATHNTPLHFAIQSDNISQPIIQSLLGHHADVNLANGQGNMPLHIAVKRKLYIIAKLLLQHAARVNAQDADGNTPLHLAVQGGNVSRDFVELLLEHKSPIDVPNRGGNTPLHLAVCDGGIDIEIIRSLIAHRADPCRLNVQLKYPRDLAVHPDVKYLVDVYFQIWLLQFKSYMAANIGKILKLCMAGITWIMQHKQHKNLRITQEDAQAALMALTDDQATRSLGEQLIRASHLPTDQGSSCCIL